MASGSSNTSPTPSCWKVWTACWVPNGARSPNSSRTWERWKIGGCISMLHTARCFSYCMARLGMSEDEACRRIELARLARKFPALFADLASGQMTLSVALVLKPVLSADNHRELLSAARGMSIRQARELLAARFPKPDAASNIRKLPEPRREHAPHLVDTDSPLPPSTECPSLPLLAATTLASPSTTPHLPGAAPRIASLAAAPARPPAAPTLVIPSPVPSMATLSSPADDPGARSAEPRDVSPPPSSRHRIEPLSAGRYRIQFTADAALKQQLEQARDLLRHAHPDGDFAPIVSRALKLLIDDVLRRRFGARRKVSRGAPEKAASTPSPAPEVPSSSAAAPPLVVAPSLIVSPAPSAQPSQVARAARRAVLERDGLRCSWLDANGVRCGSQAWLEFDHRHPEGKGGSSEPENLRLLCRAHNQLAAEHAYGREHIERAVRRRQKKARSAGPSA
jgi:hypothetical protein